MHFKTLLAITIFYLSNPHSNEIKCSPKNKKGPESIDSEPFSKIYKVYLVKSNAARR